MKLHFLVTQLLNDEEAYKTYFWYIVLCSMLLEYLLVSLEMEIPMAVIFQLGTLT